MSPLAKGMATICQCMAPNGCYHAEEVDQLRIAFVRLAEALEEILDMAERSDAHPELQFAEIARKALRVKAKP